MRIGRVVGKVVLSGQHPSLVGGQFKIVVPLTFKDLTEDPVESAKAIAQSEKERGLSPEERLKEAIQRIENPNFVQRWGNELVVYDDCSAAIGEWIAFSEGAEAAAAFGQKIQKPVDAFGGAILDCVSIDPQVVAKLTPVKK
ncbi:MAG: EutN/CcmL family microcompartment protein [Thermoguttaceae bacterium]